MQNILYIIIYSVILAWVLPPFRQYKKKYFLYFLLMAIADPINILIFKLWHEDIWKGHLLFSTLWVISLLKIKYKAAYAVLILLFIPGTILLFRTETGNDTLRNLVALNDLLIAALIAKDFIIEIRLTEKVNVFYVVLLFYNFTNFIKVLFTVNNKTTGYLYFFLTNFFQIFIAIYFTSYNEENSRKFSLIKETIPREV